MKRITKKITFIICAMMVVSQQVNAQNKNDKRMVTKAIRNLNKGKFDTLSNVIILSTYVGSEELRSKQRKKAITLIESTHPVVITRSDKKVSRLGKRVQLSTSINPALRYSTLSVLLTELHKRLLLARALWRNQEYVSVSISDTSLLLSNIEQYEALRPMLKHKASVYYVELGDSLMGDSTRISARRAYDAYMNSSKLEQLVGIDGKLRIAEKQATLHVLVNLATSSDIAYGRSARDAIIAQIKRRVGQTQNVQFLHVATSGIETPDVTIDFFVNDVSLSYNRMEPKTEKFSKEVLVNNVLKVLNVSVTSYRKEASCFIRADLTISDSEQGIRSKTRQAIGSEMWGCNWSKTSGSTAALPKKFKQWAKRSEQPNPSTATLLVKAAEDLVNHNLVKILQQLRQRVK